MRSGRGLRIRGAVVTCLAVAAACATLPEVEEEMAEPGSGRAGIETMREPGPVTSAGSEAVLARLGGDAGASGFLREHLAVEQKVNAGSPLVLGNRVTLLQDGPTTLEAMFAAIRQARDHINLETYIFEAGEVGQKFSELLLERQSEGVQVNVIYDSIGGLTTPEAFFERLREGGIRVVEFNPVNPLNEKRKTWLLNNRDHRRQLLIDGRIAFVGGVNISDAYSSSPSGKRVGKKAKRSKAEDPGWRDTHVQIEGPVVAEFQKLFLETWARQKGESLEAQQSFPELQETGNEIVRAIGSKADDPASPIYLTLVSAIRRAEVEIHLTVAYFAPDRQLLKALCEAAERGVDVKLVLPSHTDSWAIFHLGRSHYTKLLRSGVGIFERHGALMHAKTAVIDGVWSTIGSSNLDMRSFLHNDEINAVILGREFAARMEDLFAADLEESEQIVLKKWRRRSSWLRVKEQAARLGAYWL
jgi:cardiolipin synthase A/B